MHSHTYQSGQTFYQRSHSKSVSEFSFLLFLPQISCRERLLRLRMKIYKPCSCRYWPTEASGPSQKVWEALCWGMGTGLVLSLLNPVPGTGCGGLGQEAGAGCPSSLCGDTGWRTLLSTLAL